MIERRGKKGMGDLLSQRTTWHANLPESWKGTTRGSLCGPPCPEVLLQRSSPHPITLSTWGRSLISSMTCLCVFTHMHVSGCAGGDRGPPYYFTYGKTLMERGSKRRNQHLKKEHVWWVNHCLYPAGLSSVSSCCYIFMQRAEWNTAATIASSH